jgi:hypothetical protein
LKKIGLLSLKILLWIIGSLLFLLILAFVLIRIPAVQNFAKNKVVSFVEGKIKTRVEINKISLDLPKLLVLEDVYFEDQKKDTLLAGDTLKVDISLLKLLNNRVEINEIDLRGITVKVQRDADSVFNFDYIVNAFVTEQKKEPTPTDTASAMKFSLDKINLDRIRLQFNDEVMANDIDVHLGHFDTRVREFDLDRKIFSIPKIKLSGLNARIIQSKPLVTPELAATDSIEATKPFDMDLKLQTIDLDKIVVRYRNEVSAVNADLDLNELIADISNLDLRKQSVALNTLDLKNSKMVFSLGRKEQAKAVAKEAAQEVEAVSENWKLTANEVNLINNDIKFDDFNMPVLKKGMDFGHMDIKGLNFAVEQLNYAIDSISGKVISGNFADKSGFNLREIRAAFSYGNTSIFLDDLFIKTDRSELKDHIHLTYPSLESLTKNPGEMGVNARLKNSRLSLQDVITFMPEMAGINPFKSSPNAIVNIDGKVTGKVKDLMVSDMIISGFRNTNVRASARIKGLPDMNRAYFDVKIAELNTGRSDLFALAPPGSIPSNISIPQSLSLSGTFRGTTSVFNTNLKLNSSYGSANAVAVYDSRTAGRERYKADIRLNTFEVGRLIKQDSVIGRVTMAGNVSGMGIDPKTMNAVFAARLVRAHYNGYGYTNLNLKGSARNGNISATAQMADPNIVFKGDMMANLSGEYPAVKAALDLDSVNLKPLNFLQEDVRFHGKVEADLATADPDYLNGTISLTNAIIASKGERYQLDSVTVVSTASADNSTLKLRSEVLSADASGQYKLTQVGYAVQDLVSKYFNIGSVSRPPAYTPQSIVFSAKLVNGPMISQFIPDLKEMATVNINGRFNSASAELVMNASVPRVLYGTNDLNNLNLAINTKNDALNYSVDIGQINTPQLRLLNTSLSGSARDNILSADLQVKDKQQKIHYRIAGDLRSANPDFVFNLRPDGLVLNYDTWTVSGGNEVRFGNSGIQATDFVLSNNNQRLSVSSTPPGLNSPLRVEFNNFRIETLTAMVKKDSLLVGGTVDGNALIKNVQTTPVFTADVNVEDFNFRGDTLGNVALKVNNERGDIFNALVSISGEGNQVDLSGDYNTANSSLDMDLNIVNLSLRSIQGFTFGAIDSASGGLNGRLDISGTADAPKISGAVNFNKAAFNITMLNSYYRISDNQLVFNNEGLRFNDFTLIDSAQNTASVNGMVYTTTFTDYRFDLALGADNFQVINSAKDDNELYYGKMFVNTDLTIGGSMNAPAVDGILRVNDNTNFTIVLPQSDPAIEERQGIVEFVDMDSPELASVLSSERDSLSQSSITGMNISVNLEVDKAAEFNVIIDEANGDFLRLRGDAQLNAGIDPSGKITLTGVYNLDEGEYELSFNFLKRRFEIERGSAITWTGDVMTADIDVTATYIADTAPLDLVDNVLGDAPQAQRNTYKQKLPFEVNLTMTGELLKPLIEFDIVLPERNYNVSTDVTGTVNTRLAQLRQEPSELNKQVFALLLLNRFVGENPFSSAGGGGGAESLARQSVSKILSQQLNDLAGGLIAGVELNFDLESTDDYTTGQRANRTDLNVGLSKRLLNDRLRVNVGSNFEIEGPQQPGAKTSNLAGDVSVEYQLSKNGRYLLRAYQKNEYQVAIQGQVVETGVGFVLTMDYNKFKEIFQARTDDTKRRRREERAEKREAKGNE